MLFMPDIIYNQLESIATWPVVALLFIIFIIGAQGFELRHKSLGYENPGLDGRLYYSPDDARDFFNAIGPRGRRTYALTQITLDLVFPLTYGTLFAALIIHLYAPNRARMLVLIPLLTVVADLLENITTAYLAWQFDGRASSLTRGAAVFTAVKSVFFLLSLVLLLAGAVIGIWRSHNPAV